MATSSALLKVASLALLACMLLTAHHINAKLTCEEVTILLTPCISYGVFGGEVPPACCSGIKRALELAKTKEERQLKCECVKKGAAGIPGLNYTRVNELPAKCKTTSPYIVSPKTDCSKVQ